MCITIHATALQRDEENASRPLDRGPSVQPVEPPPAEAAVTGDERRPLAEEVLCHA
jgi:hypothetical protein